MKTAVFKEIVKLYNLVFFVFFSSSFTITWNSDRIKLKRRRKKKKVKERERHKAKEKQKAKWKEIETKMEEMEE